MKRRHLQTGVGVLTLTLLALSACNGSDDASSTTGAGTAVTTSNPVTTTTLVAVATTAAETPVTTTPTTTASSTPVESVPSTTAEPDLEVAKEAVIAAAVEAKETYWAARQDPTNQELVDRLTAVLGGDAESYQLSLITEGMAAGERTVPHPEVPSTYHVDPESVSVDLASGTASLTSCEINSWVLVRDEGGDEPPTVVDDVIYRYTGSEQFDLVDGVWLKVGGVQLTSAIWDGTPCGD